MPTEREQFLWEQAVADFEREQIPPFPIRVIDEVESLSELRDAVLVNFDQEFIDARQKNVALDLIELLRSQNDPQEALASLEYIELTDFDGEKELWLIPKTEEEES